MGGGSGKEHAILENFRFPWFGYCPKVVNKLVRIYIDRLYISDNKYKERRRYVRFHFILYNYRWINQYLNMPSLSALEKFKDSFKNLGMELQVLEELNLPFDDLSLPDHEPALDPNLAAQPTDESPTDVPPTDIPPSYDDIINANAPDEPQPITDESYSPPADETLGGMDFMDNIGDLLGGGADSLPVEEEPAPPAHEETDLGYTSDGYTSVDNLAGTIPDDFSTEEPFAGVDETIPEAEVSNGEGKLPNGFLNGFADEIEAERASLGKKKGKKKDLEEDIGMGLPDQNLGGFDLPEFGDNESQAPSGEEEPLSDEAFADALGDVSSGAVAEGEEEAETTDTSSFDLDLPDFGESESEEEPLSDEAFADAFGDVSSGAAAEGEEEAEATDMPGPDLDLPDFGESESEEEPEVEYPPFDVETTDTESDEEAFDFGGELPAGDEAILEEVPGDAFDRFSPESGSLGEEFDVGGGEEFGADEFGSLDDFPIPGLDIGIDDKAPGKGKKAGKKGKSSKGRESDVDEISLTPEELDLLQETLSSYPLNLRMACEELIAEQAVAPEQMSRLIMLLVDGAPAEETAALAGKILDKTIPIPKGYERRTGEDMEAEQSSFPYIFVHTFLPMLARFMAVAIVVFCAGYLSWQYIYNPIKAEKIYKLGIERIEAGEYTRANERFSEAYRIHPKKPWFYTYARAFRDSRQYTLAEEKYKELMYFTASKNKRGIPEKAAVLEYADMETNYVGDYQTADNLIWRNILDYFPNDKEGLLALGDNNLIWGEYEKERLENAREAYAKLIELYGRTDPLLERMLKYFIRTDDLGQVLSLQSYFMASEKKVISAATLAEMGGYFLDKRLEKVRGVPNEFLEYIGGIREILLRAIKQDPMLPESYYHLARYYNYFENTTDERLTLDVAVRVFEASKEESPKRIGYHINALRRYAEILIDGKEFFPAEENLVKGVNVYQNALSRRLLKPSPEYGRLYADLGDLEFFVKDGDMQAALDYYNSGEQNGWAPPEIQYRMGVAHYQMRQWGPALERFFEAFRELPFNRRILYALGNVSYMRGNYFAAQGYYDRLLEILDDDRSRFPVIAPTDDEDQLDVVERLMVAQNNLGVVLEALTERTGNTSYRSRAQGLYSDSERAWDVLTRNPVSMIRMRPSPDIMAPGVNPAYLNIQNTLYPIPGYEHQFFLRVDRDVLEPSLWEDLAPPGFRLSEGIHTGR
jgi:tetratricopeptide (TPR) repeat protein